MRQSKRKAKNKSVKKNRDQGDYLEFKRKSNNKLYGIGRIQNE
jgi:hypothetical protein